MKLCERITEHCHVLGDVTHKRAAILAEEQTTPEWRTSGAVLSMRGQNTVTDLINVSKNMDGKSDSLGLQIVNVFYYYMVYLIKYIFSCFNVLCSK